ncbi:hypothetical protein BLS_010169 [Venturia inaequalis]|uniref:Uncharacterized protein n=1 Tax=Venturia inaequalis TaxID=5025 RepID=A0A8H3U3N8_VENIN|nr:hypothetical protein BLS_010169 [Venturia inaequalis]
MGIVRTFAIAILAVSVITFVAFFGRLPVFRNTPIGFLHRVLWIHVPRICGSLDSYLTGGRLSRTGTYLLYEKHYVVTFFFLGLLTGFMAIWEYWIDILGTAFMVGGISRGGVGMLSTLTAPLPLGLLAYHIYLIWAGMTTNETSKWSDVREDMNDGEVFIADLKHSSIDSASASISSMDVVDDYRSEASFESEWPQRSRQFLIRTHDGQPPKNVRPQIADLVVQDSWRRIWHLGDVENIYDLGFWGNVMEALVN